MNRNQEGLLKPQALRQAGNRCIIGLGYLGRRQPAIVGNRAWLQGKEGWGWSLLSLAILGGSNTGGTVFFSK
jgi:hypothetical protein